MDPYMVVLPNGDCVSSYYLVYAASAVVYLGCALGLCRRYQVPVRTAFDLGALYVAAMTVLSALAYDALNRETTWRTFTVGRVLEGGLIGGGLIVLALVFAYAWAFRLTPRVLDIGSVALPLGLAVAKVSCYLHGCCYGAGYDGLFAVVFPEGSVAPAGTPVHPTQLYDMVWFLVVFAALLVFMFGRRTPAGWSPVWFVLLFCAGRFGTDSLRGDGTEVSRVAGVTQTQAAYALGLIVAAALIIGPTRWWDAVVRRFERRASARSPWLERPAKGRRLRAALLDILGAGALAIVAVLSFGAWEPGVWLYALVGHAVPCALFGGTLGMIASGVAVVREDGRPVRLAASLRSIAWVFSGLTLLGVVSGWLDRGGRSFCDAMAGTVVVPRAHAARVSARGVRRATIEAVPLGVSKPASPGAAGRGTVTCHWRRS